MIAIENKEQGKKLGPTRGDHVVQGGKKVARGAKYRVA